MKIRYQIAFNWLVFLLYVLMCTLIIQEKIVFGHGLGDMIYLIIAILIGLTQLILNLTFANPSKERSKKKNLIIGFVFLLILFSFGLKFTIGRGAEMKWDGNIIVKNQLNFNDLELSTPQINAAHVDIRILHI